MGLRDASNRGMSGVAGKSSSHGQAGDRGGGCESWKRKGVQIVSLEEFGRRCRGVN